MHMYIYIYIYIYNRRLAQARLARAKPWYAAREFAKGGFVNGGLAIRYVFNLHIKHGT